MSRVRIAILQLTMLCLIFLGLAYSSPTVRAETVKPAVPQLQINQTQNVYIDPKYEYALSVPDGWYIYPTPNNVLYGAAVFTNYDVNSLENFHTLPPLGIKIQIGVGPLNKSLAEWANERLTTETAAGSSEPQQLFASRILPIQVGPSLGLVSVIAGPNGYTLAEIILPRGNDEVVSIGITTSEKEGRNAALDLLKTFSVTGMKNFNPDATPISQQIREQIDLLEDEVRIQAPETPLGTCPAGTFPGNEAPSSPITLWMPFQEGQRWVVGGVGSFYGNGYHCNSNNDYYATDWNRSDGASSGSAALPVAGGNIDSSQVTQPPCPNTGYGCKVVVNHGSGIETLYGHLSGISRTSGGVNHWDQIGAVGTTGNSTGAHLHLRFASNGSSHCWNNGANCPNGEAPLSPQSSKPSPMNTQSGAVTLADGTSYVSNNKQDSGGGGPSGYTFCANENQRCNFSGTKDVAYGANGSFNYKYNISDGIDCNNSTFGDPISGVGKACYTKDSSQTGCNPNPDQVALFEHGGYGGNCQVFNKGDYPNPGAMGFPNDTASSVKVGGNVKAILCKDDNYGGCEEFNGDDGNLGDNGIGDNQVSSLKVQDRGGQTGCNPNSDQVALFEHGGYGGNCKVFNKGEYPNPGAMGFPNDTASSVKVGGNVKAILCKDDNYGGCEEFNGDDGNLGDNGIGDNQVSSLKVQDRGSSGGNGVEFCDGTNYGSPCITLTAGKYGNLNDIGWYDRIESLRFKGNYVGNYHVVMSTETGHGGTPGHFEKDEPNLQDPWRNRTRSIEIYYIDRNNPPGTPSLSSPGDWYESNDGTAPNLCWNASSDPEGDNPVQYYTEVFDSAVNGNSGWTTNTCWRPSNLDNQYFGYQWRVKARDNKNKESGWSETRHFTIKQPAPQKPDLRPATLSGYPAPLVPSSTQGTHQTNTLFANARTFIDWHFTNVGNGVASGNFYVDVYFDDQRVVHYPYSDFGAGGTGGFDDWAATFNATGVHKLKIVTDPDNAVQESDENNNVWEQQFIWVAINGWRGEYFKNATLDSNPWLTRDDANIDFDWAGGSPDAALPVDNFSARWTRTAAFECGRYRFNVHVDDGARLWVNNQKILDEWRDQVADFHPEVDLTAGALPIQVEYYEGGGGAAIQVSWQKLSSCVTKPSAPHDPAPANGASLSYRTESDVSVQGEGDKFIFHVWGNNYDRWSDWTSSRSLHLDGLTNQTYNFQAQARNSAGASPWSAVWTFNIQAQAPSANWDAWPQTGNAPLTVAMHIVNTSNITSCLWDYGDGQTGASCDSSHNHVYNNPGTYTVRLDVSGPGGSDTLTRSNYINAQQKVNPPAAPHDPAPANGASLSYRTESDVSAQGEGDKFIFHVWGNNYDRWSDWTSSRSLHLDGLTNQTYNFQAQARNSAGASPWSAVWTFTIQPAPSQQLVLNPGFEVDDDGNGIPDNWGNNVKFMRVGTPRRSDSYAGRLSATDNKNVTITQQISNLSAGQTYNASCWVRIKKTADVFAFKVQVRWRDSANKILRTDVIGRTFTGKTVGWEQAARTMSAPTGTATAQFQFKATSLNAKIYLDDCSFTP